MPPRNKILIFLTVLLLILPITYGIGVGLFLEEINFEPYLDQNFEAFINNNMGYDAQVRLAARGALSEYITFSEEYLEIPAGRRSYITFNMKLPAEIAPGRNRVDIGAEDITPLSGGGLSSRTAAYMGFFVRAPYPGKYIEASFSAADAEENEDVEFSINIISRGNETIDKITGAIEIFDQENKIGSLVLEPALNITPGETRAITARWNTQGQKIGEYRAKAFLDYDSQNLSLDTQFKIGTLLISILNYTQVIYQDEINRLDVEIESLWNKKIEGAYGTIEINNNKIKTDKAELNPWSKINLEGYYDASNIALGVYEAVIKVYYSDKAAEKTGNVTVLPRREKEREMPSNINLTTTLLIIAIILLLMINVMLAAHFIRRSKKEKRKKR